MTGAFDNGLRRVWTVLAIATALLFALLAEPGHAADGFASMGNDVAAASLHHPGDGDAGGDHHGPAQHCASHCAGHAVTIAQPVAVSASVQAPSRDRAAIPDDARRSSVPAQAPLRPPSA